LASILQDALERVGGSVDTGVKAAADRLLEHYYFHIVYRKFPEEYELFSRSQEFLLEELFPVTLYRGRSVLDLGCGTGKLVDHIAPHAARLTGIDLIGPMLAVARRKCRLQSHVDFLVGNFQSIPLPDASVDNVVSNMAFPSSERTGGGPEAVRQLKRVLRRGGEIRLTSYDSAATGLLQELGFSSRLVAGGLSYPVRQLPGIACELQRIATSHASTQAGEGFYCAGKIDITLLTLSMP
jgi:ubiquinone/menaquinone biosynthesis C-methylase UbiE